MSTLKNNPKQYRSYFIKGLLVSLGVAGATGIWVLLSASFGSVEGRILATTMLIGLYSLLSLCCLTMAGRRHDWIAVAGIIASTIALVSGVALLWLLEGLWGGMGGWLETLWRSFFVFGIVGVSAAHASLLLLLADKPNKTVQTILMPTLGCIVLVAAMLILPILQNFEDLPEFYWRLLGVLAILDVVGTVAAPAVAKMLPAK